MWHFVAMGLIAAGATVGPKIVKEVKRRKRPRVDPNDMTVGELAEVLASKVIQEREENRLREEIAQISKSAKDSARKTASG